MLESLSPQRRQLVLAVTCLLATGTLVIILVLVAGLLRSDTKPAAQGLVGPVVVVPGYGGRTASLAPIVAALRRDGRQVVVFTPAGDGTGDLRKEAELLGQVVERARKRAGTSSVDVIGYSAGGVVARLWVRDNGGAEIARRVLTLGSPHHGTSQAALAAQLASGSCTQACLQLTPDSDLLRRLNAGDETPDGPVWIALRSTSDTVVTPTDSAVLDGAFDLAVQDVCPEATTAHGELPGDPVVLASLISTLGTDAPRAPTGVSC